MAARLLARKRYCSTADFARLTGMKRGTVTAWCERGVLKTRTDRQGRPVHRDGEGWQIVASELRRVLREQGREV